MTREEAIRIFRKEIECLSHTKCEDCILEKACDPMNTTPYDSEYIEAYSMAIKALEQEPTTKNDLVTLTFSKGALKYSCKDYVVYKKDWLRSHYGAEIDIMFGDSQYKEPTTKNDLGVDCISRESIKQKLQEHHDFFVNAYGGFSNLPQNDKSRVDEITNCIAMVVNEPSVTPQEPKTGHWISHREHCENLGVMPSGLGAYEWCSNCDYGIDVREWHRNHYNYCPNCGADMRGED